MEAINQLPSISFDIGLGPILRQSGTAIDIDLENVANRLEQTRACGDDSILKSVKIGGEGPLPGMAGNFDPLKEEMNIFVSAYGRLVDEPSLAQNWQHETDHVEYFQSIRDKYGYSGLLFAQRLIRFKKIGALVAGAILAPLATSILLDNLTNANLPNGTIQNISKLGIVALCIDQAAIGIKLSIKYIKTGIGVERRAYKADKSFIDAYTPDDAVITFKPHDYGV